MRKSLSTKFIFGNILVLLLIFGNKINAQNQTSTENNVIPYDLKWSERTALSILNKYPNAWQLDGNEKPKWDYKMGFVLLGFEKLYQKTNNKKYLNYIKEYVDGMIDSTGNIKKYDVKEYNIDCLNPGKLLFNLYDITKDSRYLKIIGQLRNQLESQPRTPSGGFWHKQIYPNQMWIDGLYMAEPFYAQFTVKYEKGKSLDDIAKQFELVQNHLVDQKTGLVYQAWDESKEIAWADKQTGTSPTIWGRGIGWYMVALVETLDYFPKSHPKHKVLVEYLNQIAKNVNQYKSDTGLWYQVADKPELYGNYVEPSASGMIIYAFAKGANKGYLASSYKTTAKKSFDSFVKEFVKVDKKGEVNVLNVSSNVGLGGKPFRDGTNYYYLVSKTKENGAIGLGAFLLSAIELDK
ncbi:Unsaturated rhamnogalacturonyl hydrolase YteR [Flavobacterium sp. ACN2]|uniref:glycoside hydrolase family 88/105 protein n=1 Tax=unclassified Flavobacterium TaxID=196869 RepID=UPI000BB305EE|nr:MULTISPECIES: glycoside hydrolase family 88 protein [unclassified Flavobacterium]MDY0988353.1 glycoside hydrolase family 88 protein [Flavobacterium sp. CFBP9031]PBI86057.1 Unsaturated rhamnogalacturonyl hydrolase YteR [Flavobacterium sp. ACN2]